VSANTQKSITKLKQDAAKLLQKLVRMKAADENGYARCVTCDRVEHWKNMDGGHWISRNHAHLLLEENIHPQCKGCNRFMSGCHEQYTFYMIDTYGEGFCRELMMTKRQLKKYNRSDLMVMIDDFKARIKEQEDRLQGL
jgi:hypothetical protein